VVACAKAGAMRLNGGFTATVVGIVLTGVLGWTVYVTKQIGDGAVQLAVIETKVNRMERSLARIEQWLADVASGRPPQYDRDR